MITYKGVTKTMNEWARFAGMSPQAFRMRIENGWSMADALNVPIQRVQHGQPSLSEALPAFADYQRDMNAAYHELTRSLRQMVCAVVNQQMVDFRREIDDRINAQREQANRAVLATHTPGVGKSISKSANDRTTPVAQDRG